MLKIEYRHVECNECGNSGVAAYLFRDPNIHKADTVDPPIGFHPGLDHKARFETTDLICDECDEEASVDIDPVSEEDYLRSHANDPALCPYCQTIRNSRAYNTDYIISRVCDACARKYP
jgi:hypothetical protein